MFHRSRAGAPVRLGRVLSLFTPVAALLLSGGLALAEVGALPDGVAKPVPAAASAPAAAAAPSSGAPAADGRVFVLGFDGADWRTTESMMNAGQLPNMAKLREGGSAGPLVSTDPAESAAGWAAINTGANPLKNGVPSFIKRSIGPNGPSAGFAHVEKKTIRTDKLEVDGMAGAIGGDPNRPWIIGASVFFIGTLLLRLVLKVHALLALIIGVLLGGASAYGLRFAGEDLPTEIPNVVVNQVKLDGFWVEAARAGHPSVALQAPLAFDRPGVDGARTLYGLGLPDVRASFNGDWFVYTTDTLATGRPPKGSESDSSSGTGTVYRVDFKKPAEGDGPKAIRDFVYGPVNFVEMDAAQQRINELGDLIAETDDYKTSKALVDEQGELNKKLSEMLGSKSYKHRVTAPLVVVPSGEGQWDVTIGNTTQTLTAKAWSDFYQVEFELGPIVSVNGVTRARIINTSPFELYVDTINLDPANPAFWQPSSSPASFSKDIAAGLGSTYETLGWGCMTNQLKDELLDPEVFLEDVEFTMTYRRKIMQRMLEENDWEVLYSVFSTTDRVQHMMYRYYDPEHPMYDAEGAKRTMTFFGEEITFADAIPAIYRQMDSIVGEIMDLLQDGDTLMLCADHGFTSFRRGMHVNNWLESEGLLVLKEDVTQGQSGGFECVDWSKTKAYGLGLGMVFLNLEGRETNGIVSKADARGVLEDIQARFLAARDEGRKVGSSATILEDVYSGPEAWDSPTNPCADLMLGFAEYYRVSWSSVAGSLPLRTVDGKVLPKPIYQDNDSTWSGDHASNDPNVVTGIFFCNRKVASEDGTFSVMDIAPTVLDRLGAPLPAYLDRPALKFE